MSRSEHGGGNAETRKELIGSSSNNNNNRAVGTTAPPTSSSSPQPSLFDGRTDSLNLDGALYRILEYLTPSDFYTLGALTGSRFWKRFLFENPESEYLFSPPKANGQHHPTTSKGRTHLQTLRFFRTSVEGIPCATRKGLKRNRRGSSKLQQQKLHQHQDKEEEQQPLNRVGVFSPHEEDSILTNDTNGYFGLSFFRPGVLAVWGDYSGMFLTSHVDRLFSSQKQNPLETTPPDAEAKTEARFCRSSATAVECEANEHKELLDKDETITNVSASAAAASTPYDTKTMGKEGCGYLFADSYQVMAILAGCKPYVFLGFASGTIHSIDSRPVYKDLPSSSPSSRDPTTTESGKIIEYPHVSECRYHCQKGEISNLTSIEHRHMVSSSMRVNAIVSEILIHWNALEDGNLQNISRIKINAETFHVRGPRLFDDIWDVSPLAMASSSFLPQWNGPVLSIGAKGQNMTHLCLWSSHEHIEIPLQEIGTETNKPGNPPPLFEPSKLFRNSFFCKDQYRMYRAKRARDRRSHHFVYLKYFQKTNLVIGTSKGDLLRIQMDDTSKKAQNKCILYNCCRGGMVEAVELVGNIKPIMITAGGYDGKIRFWDWETFDSLGDLRIHPGKQSLVAEAALAASSRLAGTTAAAMPIAHHRYSPVVSTFFCHERSSLVSFCRDGHLHEWRVEDNAKKVSKLAKKIMTSSTKSKRNNVQKKTQTTTPTLKLVDSPSRSTRALGHYKNGTIIRKRHNDNTYYEGEITSFDPISRLYEIKYENGVTAEYRPDEVKRIYKHEQKYSSQKYTKACLKID